MGVSSLELIDIEVQVLRELGFQGAFVMHGLEAGSDRGMDELSTLGPTHIAELHADGRIERYTVTPEDFGLRRAQFADLASSRNVHQDALALLRVLMGKDEGPRYDIICLNAAPMLYIMGQAGSLHEGMVMAGEPCQWQRAGEITGLGHLAKCYARRWPSHPGTHAGAGIVTRVP